MKINILHEEYVEKNIHSISTEIGFYGTFILVITISIMILTGIMFWSELDTLIIIPFALEILFSINLFDSIYQNKSAKLCNLKESYALFKLNTLKGIRYQGNKKIPCFVFRDKITNNEITRKYNLYGYSYEPIDHNEIYIDFKNMKISLSAIYIIERENTKEIESDELDYI